MRIVKTGVPPKSRRKSAAGTRAKARRELWMKVEGVREWREEEEEEAEGEGEWEERRGIEAGRGEAVKVRRSPEKEEEEGEGEVG